MPTNDLRIPRQVLDSIRTHIEKAVKRAESGYSSAQEAEDAVTGALGENLRTDGDQFVSVTEDQRPGTWRWNINYSKFGSGGTESTESVVGADGILEVRVGGAEYDQQKSSLFQAKNTSAKQTALVEQCAKMSLWREAAFVIAYSEKGYRGYAIDDVLLAKGSLAKAENSVPLAEWITDVFLVCKNGHRELYYDRNERRLYWTREKISENDTWTETQVWVDFSPKHIVHLNIIPPNWRWSEANEISYEKIPLSRLTVEPIELFGMIPPFTLNELKKRRAILLRAFHSDNSYHLNAHLKSQLDMRVIEINRAYDQRIKLVTPTKTASKSTQLKRKKPSSIGESRAQPVSDFVRKTKPRRVRRR